MLPPCMRAYIYALVAQPSAPTGSSTGASAPTRSRQIADIGSGIRGKRKVSSKANPFSKSRKATSSPIDVDAPVLGRGFALDPIRLEGKKVCHCDIDEVLDLEFRGKRYVARVTKFEMYKYSKSSGGSSSSRDGELLIYLKVNNNIVHCR